MENKENQISTTSRTNESINEEKKQIENESIQDQEIINLLKNINIDSKDLQTLINDLSEFNSKLTSLKNFELLLTADNIEILKKINKKNNIKINLLLSRIYMNLLNNELLYLNYLSSINEEKINLLLQIIEECLSLIKKLKGFVFDQRQFDFKTKTLSFIKCLYFNCKRPIKNSGLIQKLEELVETVPEQLYSETFNDLNNDKTLFDIWKSQDKEKINNFEEKFAQINNYFEQYEAFCKFVETNSGVVKYDAVGGEENSKNKEEEKKSEIDMNNLEFYEQYGLLLLKFCKYHQYVFLNQQPEIKPKEIEKDDDNEENNIRVVFLLDKINTFDEGEKNEEEKKEEPSVDEHKEENEEKKDEAKENNENKTDVEKEKDDNGNNKIRKILSEKVFTSIIATKEFNELIKKEIDYYLKNTKSIEDEPKIKTIIDQLSYFESILDVNSFVPLYLNDFSKISISDNFTPAFLTNVPAGKTSEFYLETKEDENMLVYIEFSLEDKSKDITFEINKYQIESDSFKPLFKEEKVDESFKLFILCKGYSLYQIVFNNSYSWFNSKDVNYRITVLKLTEKPSNDIEQKENKEKIEEDKKEDKKGKKEEKQEEKIEEGEEAFSCYFNGKNNYFYCNKINQKIKNIEEKKEGEEEVVNIPVVLYLNNLRIVSLQKGGNEKEEVKFIEEVEEDEDFIPKHYFDFQLINYIKKKLKIKPGVSKNKKIIISIFSLNRDLSTLYKDVEDQINALNVSTINNTISDNECINYLEKIGFYPNESLEGYNVHFKLYDLCEQSLIYHLYSLYLKDDFPKKSVLFMQFDKLVVNASVFNEGAIFSKLKGKKEKDSKWKSSYFNNININDVNGILDFLENANDTFEGIDLVLSHVDTSDDERKSKLMALFEKIKKHCKEAINPPVQVFVYANNEIENNVFKYMNLFYEK